MSDKELAAGIPFRQSGGQGTRSLLEGISRFFLLMAVLYLFWWIWEKPLNFFPVTRWINEFSGWMVQGLYRDSERILTRVFHLQAWYDGQRICLGSPGSLSISYPCSGIRQFTQFTLLMIFYPGPWNRKAWFVPAGLLVVHFTNLIRIVGLSLVIVYIPRYWDLFHGFITKGMFYLVFFLLWILWEEYVSRGNFFTRSLPPAGNQDH
ncbi:MAG TPA: exosortase/archaeosortase family protein [Bacteroidales bacterium]|nr:exosortase/archaeosortase family protein [Bacteroidales bacterium]HNS46497.1 exosortase/archaeosortase family protein [Bacteroidales bacterium]